MRYLVAVVLAAAAAFPLVQGVPQSRLENAASTALNAWNLASRSMEQCMECMPEFEKTEELCFGPGSDPEECCGALKAVDTCVGEKQDQCDLAALDQALQDLCPAYEDSAPTPEKAEPKPSSTTPPQPPEAGATSPSATPSASAAETATVTDNGGAETELETLAETAMEMEPTVPPSTLPTMIPTPKPSPSSTPVPTVNGASEDTGGEAEESVPPTPSPDAGEARACFPAHAVVQLADGRTKRMSDIEIGDHVMVGADTFSEVFSWGHRDKNAISQFVRLETTRTSVELTGTHYLVVNGHLALAREAKSGDLLSLSDGSTAPIITTSTVSRRGLFNPHTMSGTVAVNGVVASVYTEAVAPRFAHALLFLPRVLYRLAGVDILQKSLYFESPRVATLMPKGACVYR